jgi:uncharacterized protein YabN with tetrapyrrole methylase and pyrophosphatase domain
MKDGSLVIVGLGIKFTSHLTIEAETYIKKSCMVFYLANEPAMKKWIEKINCCSESLDKFYSVSPLRLYCYQAMSSHVLNALRKSQHVCFVLYGHPTILAKPALDAVLQARAEGYYTKIIPAISSEDCLFADLMINPGQDGCLSFETTDFLIHRRIPNPSSHLVLWQVGIIGALTYPEQHNNVHGAHILVNYLKTYYSLEHNVILYEAAQYPHFEPRIEQIPLFNLPFAKFSPLTTLYIPPTRKLIYDQSMLDALNINIADLKI